MSGTLSGQSTTQAWLKVMVSIVLMVLLLWWFLRSTELSEVFSVLVGARVWPLLGAVVLALASYALRAVRWGFILRPVQPVRGSSLLLATATGYAAMALLPARMGDLVRPLLLAQRERLPVSASLASVVTERLFDLWSVVLFFLVFVFVPPRLEHAPVWLPSLTRSGWVAAAGLGVGTAFLMALFRYQDALVRIVSWPFARFWPTIQPPVEAFLGHFLDGLRIVQRWRDLGVVLALSFGVWMMVYWQLQLTLMAFEIVVPLRGAFVLVALTVIGLAIPTPGGAGGFHQALRLGLVGLFGVDQALAVAAAIAYHAICFGPITLIGVACIPALGTGSRWRRRGGTEPDER